MNMAEEFKSPAPRRATEVLKQIDEEDKDGAELDNDADLFNSSGK